MTPQRIQRQRTKGWRMPPGAVNVCRPCDWGNPYRIGDQLAINAASGPLPSVRVTRELAVELFRAYVIGRGWTNQIRADLCDSLPDGDPDKLRRAEVLEWERARERAAVAEPNPHFIAPPPPGGYPMPETEEN